MESIMKNDKIKRIIVSAIAIILCIGLVAGLLISAFYSVL